VAGKSERQRRLARERYERRNARRQQHDHQTRRTTIAATLSVLAIVAIAVGSVFAFRGPSGPAAPASASSPAATASPSPAASPAPPASAPVSEPARSCTYTASPPAARKVTLPPAAPDYTARYSATIKTSRGAIAISLLNSKATCTVNSFAHLAGQNYFSGTTCHRLVTSGIYVLQCGDPTGTGSGGPGYRFADENLTGAKYTAGTVAMANSGANTNGSQFFLVYKDSPLPPSYTPFGTITGGLTIIQQVAHAGSDNSGGPGDGHPKDKVVIEGLTIKKT